MSHQTEHKATHAATDREDRALEDSHDPEAAADRSLRAFRVEAGMPAPAVQRRANGERGRSDARSLGAFHADVDVQETAQRGVTGAAAPLPHFETIQRSFGGHDVSGVEAHVGGSAAGAAEAIGAEAYATGNQVAFRSEPDLHTAAHEAAHVVQQRAGVHLKGGVGEEGDTHEQHADAVADRVVAGQSAEALLGSVGGATSTASSASAVQRRPIRKWWFREGARFDAVAGAHGDSNQLSDAELEQFIAAMREDASGSGRAADLAALEAELAARRAGGGGGAAAAVDAPAHDDAPPAQLDVPAQPAHVDAAAQPDALAQPVLPAVLPAPPQLLAAPVADLIPVADALDGAAAAPAHAAADDAAAVPAVADGPAAELAGIQARLAGRLLVNNNEAPAALAAHLPDLALRRLGGGVTKKVFLVEGNQWVVAAGTDAKKDILQAEIRQLADFGGAGLRVPLVGGELFEVTLLGGGNAEQHGWAFLEQAITNPTDVSGSHTQSAAEFVGKTAGIFGGAAGAAKRARAIADLTAIRDYIALMENDQAHYTALYGAAAIGIPIPDFQVLINGNDGSVFVFDPGNPVNSQNRDYKPIIANWMTALRTWR